MLFSLDFVTMLLLFLLIIDVYFLIHEVIVQTFNPVAELVIPIEIPSKKEKAETEAQPVTVNLE